jgi:hypothetical protein
MRCSEADDSDRVNCALEKTNQSMSDEICRLKVRTMVVIIQFEYFRCCLLLMATLSVPFCAAASNTLTQDEIDSDKRKIAQLQKQVHSNAHERNSHLC